HTLNVFYKLKHIKREKKKFLAVFSRFSQKKTEISRFLSEISRFLSEISRFSQKKYFITY
ncbi:hypothetical protein, partial [Bacteroides thetaiotaomicron]|uniref:hypothetical protein n=1 Tax=Bacteroides thetaiotaomicron TaxID=818 RepID=UPI00376F9F4C